MPKIVRHQHQLPSNYWFKFVGGKIKCQQKRESVRAGSFLVALGLVEGPQKKTDPQPKVKISDKRFTLLILHSRRFLWRQELKRMIAETKKEVNPIHRNEAVAEDGCFKLKVWRSWKCDTKDVCSNNETFRWRFETCLFLFKFRPGRYDPILTIFKWVVNQALTMKQQWCWHASWGVPLCRYAFPEASTDSVLLLVLLPACSLFEVPIIGYPQRNNKFRHGSSSNRCIQEYLAGAWVSKGWPSSMRNDEKMSNWVLCWAMACLDFFKLVRFLRIVRHNKSPWIKESTNLGNMFLFVGPTNQQATS